MDQNSLGFNKHKKFVEVMSFGGHSFFGVKNCLWSKYLGFEYQIHACLDTRARTPISMSVIFI